MFFKSVCYIFVLSGKGLNTYCHKTSGPLLLSFVFALRGIPVFEKIIHWTIEFIQNKQVPWNSRVGVWKINELYLFTQCLLFSPLVSGCLSNIGDIKQPFPTYRRFLTPLNQATDENIVAKG